MEEYQHNGIFRGFDKCGLLLYYDENDPLEEFENNVKEHEISKGIDEDENCEILRESDEQKYLLYYDENDPFEFENIKEIKMPKDIDEDKNYRIFEGSDALEVLLGCGENDPLELDNNIIETKNIHSDSDFNEFSYEPTKGNEIVNASIDIDNNDCNKVIKISKSIKAATDVHPFFYTGSYVGEKRKSRRKKMLQCEINGCNRRFLLEAFYKSHLLLHKKINRYVCQYCKSVLSDKNTLMKHESRHFGKDGHLKMYQCVILGCGEMFKSIRMLREHESLEHLNSTMQYHCEKCYRYFYSAYKFAKHRCGFMDKSRSFCCIECRKYFNTKGELNGHKKIHGNVFYACEKCGEEFCKRSGLRIHRAVHKGRNFYCKICFANFTYSKSFTNHMIKQHPIAWGKDLQSTVKASHKAL